MAAGASAVLRSDRGGVIALDCDRWHGQPTPAESRLLAAVNGPALDVGCGPGRLVVGLARLGVLALGVDPAPGAVNAARRRGAAVLQRSIFDPLPREGRWGTALLVDGNIGIGGEPVRLLARCRALVSSGGTIIAELHPPGTGYVRHRARFETGVAAGPWFGWAQVGVDAIDSMASLAGLTVERIDHFAAEGRWFAHLTSAREAGRVVA
jgi:SAM-dependent methyltransferase